MKPCVGCLIDGEHVAVGADADAEERRGQGVAGEVADENFPAEEELIQASGDRRTGDAAGGAAGQRCMAISAAVFVGGFERWKQPLLDCAKALKVGLPGCMTAGLPGAEDQSL